jgi:putative sigma-54 modulation protein
MKFGIRGRHMELTEALLAHVESRLRLAMSRFGQKIRQAAVQLKNLNGPHGRFDKQCKVTVTLFPSGKVIVKAVDADLHTAIDRAADRLERSVMRKLERRRRT